MIVETKKIDIVNCLKKALKEHTCINCNKVIKKGEIYVELYNKRRLCLKCAIEILKNKYPNIGNEVKKWIKIIYKIENPDEYLKS